MNIDMNMKSTAKFNAGQKYKKYGKSLKKLLKKPLKKSYLENSYKIPIIKKINWDELFEKINTKDKNIILKLRDIIVPKLNDAGIHVEFVPLPIDKEGRYWMDFPWSYTLEKNPKINFIENNVPLLMIILKLDQNLKLNLVSQKIMCQHQSIIGPYKKKLIEIMMNDFKNQYEWNEESDENIIINF